MRKSAQAECAKPEPPAPLWESSAASGLYAGTSGWAYPTWKPEFYPAGVSTKNFLAFYSSRLSTVEVNYTFRKLPSVAQLEGWLSAVPAGFRFSFKAPQRITHMKRLNDVEGPLADFLAAVRPAALAGKLGVLLFQLPPNFKFDSALLKAFLASPALCFEKGSKLREPRIAFEFRHESWFNEETYALLRRAKAALCVAEGDTLVTPEVHTAADLAYFRLRRDCGYHEAEVAAQVEKLVALASAGREVFVYFRHQDEPTGALNAAGFLAEAAAREDR